MPRNSNSNQSVMCPAKSKTSLSQQTKTKIFTQDIPDDVQQEVLSYFTIQQCVLLQNVCKRFRKNSQTLFNRMVTLDIKFRKKSFLYKKTIDLCCIDIKFYKKVIENNKISLQFYKSFSTPMHRSLPYVKAGYPINCITFANWPNVPTATLFKCAKGYQQFVFKIPKILRTKLLQLEVMYNLVSVICFQNCTAETMWHILVALDFIGIKTKCVCFVMCLLFFFPFVCNFHLEINIAINKKNNSSLFMQKVTTFSGLSPISLPQPINLLSHVKNIDCSSDWFWWLIDYIQSKETMRPTKNKRNKTLETRTDKLVFENLECLNLNYNKRPVITHLYDSIPVASYDFSVNVPKLEHLRLEFDNRHVWKDNPNVKKMMIPDTVKCLHIDAWMDCDWGNLNSIRQMNHSLDFNCQKNQITTLVLQIKFDCFLKKLSECDEIANLINEIGSKLKKLKEFYLYFDCHRDKSEWKHELQGSIADFTKVWNDKHHSKNIKIHHYACHEMFEKQEMSKFECIFEKCDYRFYERNLESNVPKFAGKIED